MRALDSGEVDGVRHKRKASAQNAPLRRARSAPNGASRPVLGSSTCLLDEPAHPAPGDNSGTDEGQVDQHVSSELTAEQRTASEYRDRGSLGDDDDAPYYRSSRVPHNRRPDQPAAEPK
jgi:hypothetical protein